MITRECLWGILDKVRWLPTYLSVRGANKAFRQVCDDYFKTWCKCNLKTSYRRGHFYSEKMKRIPHGTVFCLNSKIRPPDLGRPLMEHWIDRVVYYATIEFNFGLLHGIYQLYDHGNRLVGQITYCRGRIIGEPRFWTGVKIKY